MTARTEATAKTVLTETVRRDHMVTDNKDHMATARRGHSQTARRETASATAKSVLTVRTALMERIVHMESVHAGLSVQDHQENRDSEVTANALTATAVLSRASRNHTAKNHQRASSV